MTVSDDSSLARRLDRFVIGGIVGLIVLTPLAIGSVLPCAYGAAEAVVFVLVGVWMAKLATVPTARRRVAHIRGLLVPSTLFVLLVLFQLAPLPPSLIRVLSPSTYNLYARVLAGWPGKPPLIDLLSLPPSGQNYMVTVLPSEEEVRAGVPIPSARPARERGQVERSDRSAIENAALILYATRWRPLSVAPSLTATVLLQLAAYGSLFFLVLLYPFEAPRERGKPNLQVYRVYRIMVGAIVATGLLVASIAILERALWNGKILWMYAPYDWGGRQPDPSAIERARGPFVNPDHFSAYLNLILPLAAVGVLFRAFAAISKEQRDSARVSFALAAFVMVTALVLSLSRGGWLGAMAGMSVIAWCSGYLAPERRPLLLRLPRRLTIAIGAAGCAAVLLASILFVGGQARQEVGARIHETLTTNSTLLARLEIWRDSLPMVRDFPLFGIGLGCFADLFPHYRSPPWQFQSVPAAHNDYFQLLIETGLTGFALMAWLAAGIARRVYAGIKTLRSETLPIAAAALAGVAAMAFQEFFDFNLQVPANAILFAIVLAIALRLTDGARDDQEPKPPSAGPWAAGAAALGLAAFALTQSGPPYPYSLRGPASLAAARTLVLEHPAAATVHLWMANAAGERFPAVRRARELEAAVWLDPNDPHVRDAYAQALAWSDQQARAMEQVKRSVFVSPELDTHAYLRPRIIPWLPAGARLAVESGLKMAAAHDFTNAIWQLSTFYDTLGQYQQEAELFDSSAAGERDRVARAQFLVYAGECDLKAKQDQRAEHAFRAAVALDPLNPSAYESLATKVLAPRGDIKAVRDLLNGGIQNGADPFALYLALADASEKCGDSDGAEAALRKVAEAQPGDFDITWRLARFYMRQKRFDRAALWMRKAAGLRPGSADIACQLAIAEEAGYHYFEAERDFREALRLAPGNAEIQSHYDAFSRRLATGSAALPPASDP